MADEYNPGSSGDGYYFNYRKTLHDPIQAKTCYFYKDNDYKQAAAKVAIHPKRYRKFDNLLSELTRLIPSLPFGVRSVYTPRGRSHIYNTDSLMHEGRYICSTHGHFARGVDVARVCPPDTWHLAKPASGQRQLNVLLQEHEYDEFSRAKRRRLARSGGIIYSGKRPKKITVMRNGDPSFRHLMLLNRKTAQTFDQVMEDMSDMFKFAVRKLYTIDGRRITSLAQLFNGPDVLVVAGHEQFKAMVGFMYTPMPPSTRGGSLRSARDINTSNKRRTRRDRLVKSRGKWRVSVVTGDEPSAGTSAQVILTIYGQKGNSGPLNLGDPDGNYFESGDSNDFEIFAPGIGEIYKIRIGHDETGSHPAWYCEEVRLSDVDTGEELVFVCQEWMDSERGDRETCREIPVKRKGEPTLPVVTYEATVTTGDLWNSGTHANVYMTIYGDRGDTGVRQLKPAKANSFQQGQSDVFQIEAVSLGRLKRIIVGHDGTGQGNGWNLERIVVKDPIKNEYFNFYCGKWLDEGEDDGKIVREIQAQEEYMGDILEKRNWESEKWKFDSKNQIKLISELTGKALRIKGDGSVDAMGDLKEEWVVFNVTAKKSMVRSFGSMLNKNYHLAIDNGRTVGHGKGGAYCDFRIHVQHDLTVLLESVKYPLQFLTLLDNGRPADPRGGVDTDSSRIFYVYCKGMFRNRGVIMLRTSKTQTLAQDSEEGMYGTGKINRTAHFKVHKVAEHGVRMFESLINPGRFIRMEDKRIDCQGGKDEASHFIVAKYPDKGYVTLESATQRGLFIGLIPDGELKPTVDTGGKNVCLYPEVIEFGIPKRRNLDYDYDNYEDISQGQTHRSPRTPKTPRSSRLEDGMWKITVSSTETLRNGDVSMVAYGDKGNTGPITLAAPVKNGPIFQSGSVDEFTANLSKAGKLFKVRLEVEPKNKNSDALWKVREVKMEDLKSKEIVKLTFNRWLSPIHDDGSIVRELPVAEDEDDKLPVLTYSVMVHTGKEKGAATASNVYINLFGENGDCGRRLLHQTKNPKKFQAGQVDVFEVEGVYLGRLSKCLVGHDGTGAGDGWFLDKIVVRESSTSKVEYVFPCNKWLDSGKEDRIIERMLPVSEKTDAKEPLQEKPKDGDWKVYVTTGNQQEMGTDNKIELYVYGSGEVRGPIPLGVGKKGGPFQSGQTDEIKVNLGTKIKELQKIRIGFDGRTRGDWFLEEVKLENLSKQEEYEFKIKRWLSKSHDDGDTWREAAVVKKGETTPINAIYTVEVTTGNVPKADTSADVYINIYGKKADCGKRYLHAPNYKDKPFQIGKTNIFEIEAVPLGEFDKIIVGHTGKAIGAGWFLEKIIITDINGEESHFICNKWLDSGKGDKKIERVIYPDPLKTKTPVPAASKIRKDKPVQIKSTAVQPAPKKVVKSSPKPVSTSDRIYQLWVKTLKDSKPANGGSVSITAYGSEGKSHMIELLPEPGSKEKLFEPGNVDEFEVNVGDIGEIYKLQVTRDDTLTWEGWHLEEVRLLDKTSKEEAVFEYNCWLLRNDDGNSLVQELPVYKQNKPLHPVHTYRLSVYTGDHWAGETDSNVFITLFGRHGDTGKRGFYQPIKKPLKFRKGQIETFDVEAVDLDDLEKIVVGHDGKGHGAGWYLDKITVTETTGDKSHMQYIFPCGKWLDEGEGDGLTERELRLLDQNNSKERASTRSKSQSQGKWKVLVKTSDIEDAGTKARVYLTIFGSKDNTDTIPLGDGGVHSTDFDRGKETDFMISVGDIGDVIKIRLEHNNEGPEPSWHLDWLKLTNGDKGEELIFYGDCWLAEDQGDKQICRELPFVKFGLTPLAVLQYIVCMQTGKDREAEATDSIVSINIIGQKGETGIRPLVNSISGNNILWKSGDVDYFMIEAADVGKITKIRVVFDGDDKENNWYLESVCIREGLSSILESIFKCQQWFEVKNKSDDVAIEFYPKEIKIASALPDNLKNALPCKKFKASKGNWSITSYIGSQSDAGTNDHVYLTVFGSSSHSSPIQINKSAAFKPNAVIKTQTTLKDIGSIYKIAVSLDPSSKRSALFLNRLKLKDDDSQEEFNFEYDDWIKTSDESPEGTVYLPAIRPDIPPYPETTYLVKVTTGNMSLAETDARIFCNLIGHLGESGEMPLTKATNGKGELFERGQINTFEVSTLDIGNVKRMIIGHKEMGRGCGWYCEKVIVSPKTKGAAETIFICDRWFDSGCDDRNLMKEFSPLTSLLPRDTIPQPVKTKSKGIWMCTVITADEDKISLTSSNKNKQVSITIHGSKNVFGPKELSDKNRDLFQPGQKDIFHGFKLDSVGEVQKIQVSLGDKDSPCEWFIQEVLLRDEETGEVLRFDFSRWVGEIGADMKKEMPVIKSVDNFNKVLPYQVTVHTSEKKGAGTNSHICVTLYGKNSNSASHKLLNEKSQPVFIKPGQVDKLLIECVDLGDLEKVVVWKGPGEPWLLDRIIVKKQQYSSEEYVFEFNRWLSKDSRTREEEDTQTLTRIQPSNIVAPLDKSTKQQTSRGRYEIQTITAGGQSYTKISDIVVVFCGDKGESSPLQLDPQSSANFEPNQTKKFQVHVKDDVGELYKMRVGYLDNTQPKTWNLEKMIVQDVDTRDRFYHIFNDGIDVDDKLDGWTEFPVEWPAIAPLPVINYQVELHGDTKKPPNKNQLTCQLFGEKGSTGERILKKVVSQQKQVFLYQLEAVSLLNIYQVKLGHKNKKKGGGFHLQKLLVKEPQRGGREFLFECNQWFDTGEGDQMIERILSTAQGRPAPVASPVKTAPAPAPTPKPTPAPKKSPEKKQAPNGDWKIEIQTSEVDDAGTDANVMLTVFGNYGNSGPLPLGEKGVGFFEFGQSDEFEIWLEPSDIGKIRKIRLEHDNSGHGPGWHVDKVIMSNLGSKEEIIFPINRWLSYDDKYGDIVVEVPADIPNSKVPEVYRYYVETITSNDWGSGTDSNVYINIIGSLGDTGIRFLKNSLEDKNKFESGSTDTFEIEAVDIGKIQKIIIGHDGFGAGSGWKLDKVNVRQSRTSSEVFVFQYNKWLDEDKDDRKIETELKLTKILTDNKAKLNF